MNYLHYEVSIDDGDIIEVTLDSQANVRVLDSYNYSLYRNGDSHRYIGGLATQSPVRLSPPSGNWHVVIDLGGYEGSVSASVRVIPPEKFLHYEVNAGDRDVIEVTLDKQANVLLLNSYNFDLYRHNKSFSYYGGWAKKTPIILNPPSSGRWHVAVDLGGQEGQVNVSVRTIRKETPLEIVSKMSKLIPEFMVNPDTVTEAIAVIRWLSHAKQALGDTGESIAEDVVKRHGHFKDIKFDQPKHGFDRVLIMPNGQIVILESKVNERGNFQLGKSQQGMPEWINKNSERMTDPKSAQWSPANERIGKMLQEVGAENIPVIAVVTETKTGLNHIHYRKAGSSIWELYESDVPLDKLLI